MESILTLFHRQGESAISLEPAIRLFHHRWSVPIVAALYEGVPLTFATLAARLPASRDTLTDTLAKLEANGVIARRHQGKKTLYQLTALGGAVGAACVPLVDLIGRSDVLDLALKKWPMMVVVALGRGATRYNETKAALPGITARALAIALKELQAAGMVTRTVDEGYPPTPTYVLADKAKPFFLPLDELCRACDGASAHHTPTTTGPKRSGGAFDGETVEENAAGPGDEADPDATET